MEKTNIKAYEFSEANTTGFCTETLELMNEELAERSQKEDSESPFFDEAMKRLQWVIFEKYC